MCTKAGLLIDFWVCCSKNTFHPRYIPGPSLNFVDVCNCLVIAYSLMHYVYISEVAYGVLQTVPYAMSTFPEAQGAKTPFEGAIGHN